MADENLEKTICRWKGAYTKQSEKEARDGFDDEGTKNYRDIGCDKCDGYTFECKYYSINKPKQENKNEA